MKQIFTLFALLSSFNLFSQCGSSGGNNLVLSTTSIVIDGNMNDWTNVLNDPDNNSFDGSSDLDAPISDQGRDLRRFALTENILGLNMYFSRVGSVTNGVDFLVYLDINNNSRVDSREPVLKASWSGSNGTCMVSVYSYMPVNAANGDAIKNGAGSADGYTLPGTLLMRGAIGQFGKGSADGKSLEIFVPWIHLTRTNNLNVPINLLTVAKPFQFHISTINGNVGSIPNDNSVNDNFGGCFAGPLEFVLPVHLKEFKATLTNTQVNLDWSVLDNETADRFEVEKSTDGKDFKMVALAFGTDKTGDEAYKFSEKVQNGKVYYRLKMIDKNQKAEYSNIVSVQSTNPTTRQRLQVASVENDQVRFNYGSTSGSTSVVSIFDLSGRKINTEVIKNNTGNNAGSISFPSKLNAGVYILQLINGNEQLTTKFVKQ